MTPADQILIQPVLTLADLLAGLRMEERECRLGAAILLARSLGEGLRLAGESEEDMEHVIGPQVLDLLESAIEGRSEEAISTLETMLTNDPRFAFRPGRTRR